MPLTASESATERQVISTFPAFGSAPIAHRLTAQARLSQHYFSDGNAEAERECSVNFGGGLVLEMSRVGPPNQRKLGGLTLRLNEADYGGGDRRPPTRRNETGDTDGQGRFSCLHY